MSQPHSHEPGTEHAHEGGEVEHSHEETGTQPVPTTDAAYEGPAAEGPVVEGPAVERPAVEGPVVEGPVVEGPAAEEAPAPVHRHADGVEHSHEGGDVDHSHEGEYRTVREEVTTTTNPGGFVMRVVLTLLGGAGMISGAFLDWIREFSPSRGVDAHWRVFFSPDAQGTGELWNSAGFVVIVLGVLALVGLAFRNGWLTSLAGALGIASMVLLAITFYRVVDVDLGIQDFGLGAWLVAGGGLLALIGGFFGARRTVIVRDRELVRA